MSPASKAQSIDSVREHTGRDVHLVGYSQGHDIAVAAVTLDGGGVLTGAALTRALSKLPSDERPEIVHVVDDIPLTPAYRPLSTALQAAGLPPAAETTWYHDRTDGHYRPRSPLGT